MRSSYLTNCRLCAAVATTVRHGQGAEKRKADAIAAWMKPEGKNIPKLMLYNSLTKSKVG